MELQLLIDIVIIFSVASITNLFFSRFHVPGIVGYLLTGILVGPWVLGLISSEKEIEFMAEIGILMLMFTIGLEFSINHLIKIRKIVFAGGFLQMSITIGIIAVIAFLIKSDWPKSIFLGFITALSSTALVLKMLQERGEFSSNYGRTVVGILIFQDLVVVPAMLLIPVLAGNNTGITEAMLVLGAKAILIITFVLAGNIWIMPRFLHLIARTKSQELFLMIVILICIGVSLISYKIGLSLAFGAFLGGLMISRSEYSKNAYIHLMPFKDTFTSFFFVSIGMMLDLNFFISNLAFVLSIVVLVILIKSFVVGGVAFLLGHTFRGIVIVGLSLAQIGEFSFILVKTGQSYNLIDNNFYQYFLAVSILTMLFSPLLIVLARPVSDYFLKFPLPDFIKKGLFPLPEIPVPEFEGHIILIGKDSRSSNLAVMLSDMKIPAISLVFDPNEARARQLKGISAVYGDALNEPILEKVHIKKASAVVISIGDFQIASEVIKKIRQINPGIFIISRSACQSEMVELIKAGANQIIPEEFDTSLDMLERVLKQQKFPLQQIEQIISDIRDNNYASFTKTDD